jgi:hypothetical protein
VAEGRRILLGDLLVERGAITPARLVQVLMQQFHERRLRSERPQGVGEQLVISGAISEEQLAHALLEQTRLRQLGRSEPLGKILLREKFVDLGALQRALEELDQLAFQVLGA